MFQYKSLALQGDVDDELRSIKSRLLQTDANWGGLLSAAPPTLCSIAQLFVIAWAQWADSFVQSRVQDIPPDLRTNLVNCSDLAHAAFTEAENNVKAASLTIGNITKRGGPIYRILASLGAPNPTTSAMGKDFKNFQRLAKKCLDEVSPAVEKFKAWNELVVQVCKAYSDEDDGGHAPQRIRVKTSGLRKLWERILTAVGLRRSEKNVASENEDARKNCDEMVESLQNMNSQEADAKLIASILRDCRNNQSELMRDVVQLRDLFSLLNDVVQRIAQNITAMGTKELSGDQITDLKHDIVNLSAQYTIAGEISSTYVEVSREHITPGVSSVESMSKTSVEAADIEVVCREIAEHSKKAQNEIDAFAKKRKENVQKHLVDSGRTFEEVI